jgi:predicted PurR-regulated permease PerM
MEFGEKDVKRFSIIVTILLLAVLAFLVIRPFLFAIIGGFFLAYIFYPIYKRILRIIPNRSVSASIVSIIIVLGIFVFLWFITPILVKQFFDVYIYLQKLDFRGILRTIFPTATDALVEQLTITLNSALSSLFTGISNYTGRFISEIPRLIVEFFILGFVFFYVLKDSDKLGEFIKQITPINENKRKTIIKNFKDMTNSIIYGWVVVGVIQGLLAGLGFFVFGIENALVLTVVAILFSVVPLLGPFFVYIPVAIYLFTQGDLTIASLFLIYNLLMVSTVDNFLRSYIVARKTNIHSAIILIGMIGGFFAFGTIGLILGPLLLAYILILIESFRDRSIYTIFS